jgi:Methyltransferase domain
MALENLNEQIADPALQARMAALISGCDGWCTPNKASALYSIASLPDVQLGVEIGIFAGKSMFPVAAAFKDKNSGLHYGIEPWSNQVAIETVTNELNDDWWAKIDFPAIKRQFISNSLNFGLMDHIAIIESASDVAFRLFDSARFRGKIDLLHVDGAHSVQEALHDVTNWTKLVRPGGYVFLDDINWPTVGLAYEYLKHLGDEICNSYSEEMGFFAAFKLK